MFNSSIYKNRRENLIKNLPSGIFLFLGNEESAMNYADNTYTFRQDSTFLYYFGIDQPGLAAIIDTESKQEIIFGDDLSIDYIIWMGKQPTIAELGEKAGISETKPSNSIFAFFNDAKQKGTPIHFLPQYRPDNRIKLTELLGISLSQTETDISEILIKTIVEQRLVKSAEEIEEIDLAAKISAKMHLAAMNFLEAGMKEAEIAAKVHEIALAEGGNLSFPIIATINGQTLHNHYHGNICTEGKLFLLDAGYETPLHYAGDLTSTFPVSKHFTSKQKEIFDINIEAFNKAVSLLKPGVSFKDIHLKASEVIAEGMKSIGLLKGNMQDAVKEGAHALFFPHGLGHALGLDVHDMENLGEKFVGYQGEQRSTQFGLKSLRFARKLKPGFVHTVEPGIYFIPELIEKWKTEKKFTEFINYQEIEKYKDFGGIRYEANFVITENGAKQLGTKLPQSTQEIENLKMR